MIRSDRLRYAAQLLSLIAEMAGQRRDAMAA